jgi:hypothetical protein
MPPAIRATGAAARMTLAWKRLASVLRGSDRQRETHDGSQVRNERETGKQPAGKGAPEAHSPKKRHSLEHTWLVEGAVAIELL